MDSDTLADVGEHNPFNCHQDSSYKDSLESRKKQLLEELESMARLGESLSVSETTNEEVSKRRREVYSREDMERLRYVNMAEQRKVWKSICKGLDDDTRKDYDDLASSKRNRHRLSKKEPSSRTLGEASSEVIDNRLTNMVDCEIVGTNPLDAPCISVDGVGDEDDYSALQGDIEDDDSDEEYSIQRPAFLVEGEPNFDTGPPEDGLEYLRRVRWEASKIPKVKVVKLDKSKLNKEQSDYMPKIPDIAKCEEHLLPSRVWEEAFLAEFAQLREVLSHLQITGVKISEEQRSPIKHVVCDSEQIRTTNNSDHCVNCSGSENENDQLSSLFTDEDTSISPSLDEPIPKSPVVKHCTDYPLLSLMLKMDSVARVSMLKKKISSFCGTDSLKKNDCLWLFALCAVIDTPLHADTSASLRSLLRKCASLRAQKSVLDDELVLLNILATLAGRYFGQLES